MPMAKKVKLYRITQDFHPVFSAENEIIAHTFDPDRSYSLIATFERLNDAEIAAHAFSDNYIFDTAIISGKYKRRYRSKQTNICPNCSAEYTYCKMSHCRNMWINHQCDCGCLFEINWKFDRQKSKMISLR